MPPMLKTRQDVSQCHFNSQFTHAVSKAMDYTGLKGDSDEELANGPMGSTIREQKVNFTPVIHHLQL